MQALLQILTIALAVFLFYRMFKGGGCCGGGHNGGHGNHNGHGNHGGGCCSHGEHEHTENIQNDVNVQIETHRDPICGMYVSEKDAIIRRINGQTVYFCSENCAREYERKNS